ncbi:thioesterase II family protein [Kribbella sp. NPDC051587]|uniref:thioesterase II family protein n=1 Tax=Kribbella sp. NPDC051587 TaxID=3364119 RepID=UPI0037A431D9
MIKKTTLVCLPFAGAGASAFGHWQALAGEDLRVQAIGLPGRERRIDEEPHRDVAAAVAGVLPEISSEQVALFGHSLGAVLAYELALALGDRVVHLFVSGSPSPGDERPDRATGLSDDEFLPRIAGFAGFTHDALADEEMRDMIMPALRADVEMHENYRPSTSSGLTVPVTAIRGEDDNLVTYEQAESWSKVVTGQFEHVELPGGHMYLSEHAPALVRLITSALL